MNRGWTCNELWANIQCTADERAMNRGRTRNELSRRALTPTAGGLAALQGAPMLDLWPSLRVGAESARE
jgi:hypothetical protein